MLISHFLAIFLSVSIARLIFPAGVPENIYLRENKIVSGDKNGTFKPTQSVTGVELIGVLPRVAEFRFSAGMQPNLVAKEPSKTFSDIQNYWAASILTQMSSYCSVAAAINEMGDGFAFDNSVKRNYRRLLCGC